MAEKTVYECGLADHCGDEDPGSDIGYCDDVDIWERFESGAWTPCCWDSEAGIEWIETEGGELLVLKPIAEERIPASETVGAVDAALTTGNDDD